MLTEQNRVDIKALIETGAGPTAVWIDDLISQVTEAPVEEFSGELIDKRPEEKRVHVADIFDLEEEEFDILGPVMEIEVGKPHTKSLWARFKERLKTLFGMKPKTEEEELNELLEEFTPFGPETLCKDEIQSPKSLLPQLNTLKQAVCYAELMLPLDSEWDSVREKTAQLRKLLSTSLKPNKSITVEKGSSLDIEVEVSKLVEIRPEVINRHIRLEQQRRR